MKNDNLLKQRWDYVTKPVSCVGDDFCVTFCNAFEIMNAIKGVATFSSTIKYIEFAWYHIVNNLVFFSFSSSTIR